MHIICATDGSEGALAAARLLARLPLQSDCQLTLLTVVPPGEQGEGQNILTSTQEALAGCGASLSMDSRHGRPAEEILQAAEDQPTDLLALGASGRTALLRFLVGSVAERVARHASCSVLLVRPLRDQLQRLVVGVDGSPASARVVEQLSGLPLPEGSEIRLVTVLPRLEDLTRTSQWLPLPLMSHRDAEDVLARLRQEAQQQLDGPAADLEAAGYRVVIEVRRGDPAHSLLETAEDEAADVLVVGSHGHGMPDWSLLGSVPEKILKHARCSVLVVRSQHSDP